MENAMKTAVYLAAFVKDCQGLMAAWDAVSGTPALLPKKYAHHSTSIFRPKSKDVTDSPIGEDVVLEVCGWAADDKAQAFAILPYGRFGKYPHISMATKPGVPPFHSNELLETGPVHQVPKGTLLISARFGYFDTGGNEVFSLVGTPYEEQAAFEGWSSLTA